MKIKYVLMIIAFAIISASIYSCSDTTTNIINDLVANKITAKERLDSAYAQAQRKYSPSIELVMVFGKNVLFEGSDKGKTDITLTTGITDPNNVGAWLYIFKKPGTTDLAVYTPNPVPGTRDCIELTTLFNTNTILALIADTSAKNIISGTLGLITNSNFKISTNKDSLLNSDAAYDYSFSANPIIKFDASFLPSSSTFNGNAFFSQTGSNRTVNMFLIPGLGTLNLPAYIANLTGFPQDLWIVNYKLDSGGSTKNFIAGTVVKSNQNMEISVLGLFSKAINISKY
ncbi:MAG: hypothetical protein WC139_04975 [Candidatus Kapaibacterium sp.]